MTRRSVSLSRVLWWAGLTTVIVALMPFTLRGHARADGDPGEPDSYYMCTPQELLNATCEAPGNCLNACASKCSDGTACMQCCAQFASNDKQKRACQVLCKEIWPSTPQP